MVGDGGHLAEGAEHAGVSVDAGGAGDVLLDRLEEVLPSRGRVAPVGRVGHVEGAAADAVMEKQDWINHYYNRVDLVP